MAAPGRGPDGDAAEIATRRPRPAPVRVVAALALLAPRLPALLRALARRRLPLVRFEEYVKGIALTGAALEYEAQPQGKSLTVLLASDLHANVYGAALFGRLARGDLLPVDLVLVAGDVTDGGSPEEARLTARALLDGAGAARGARADEAGDGKSVRAPVVAAEARGVRAPVVAVGGNHDTPGGLDAFRGAGIDVLDATMTRAAGLKVFGAGDPLSRVAAVDSDPAALAAQARELAELWPALDDPDVLLVHDRRQAEEVVALAERRGRSLVVACGNDHRAAVERRGTVTIVNGGTAGASGYGALGRGEAAAYTAQLLHFAAGPRPRLRAVTTLGYAPGGRASVVREPVEG